MTAVEVLTVTKPLLADVSELTHLIMIYAFLTVIIAFDEDAESPSLMTKHRRLP